jgi:hypothetical protein
MCRRSWPPGCGCGGLGDTNKNDPNDALPAAASFLLTASAGSVVVRSAGAAVGSNLL